MSVLVERDNIGIFGRMNVGKSSLMNLLTQQETSIVDASPGTTADTKTTLMEIHGIGPIKLFDTAGIDEISELGEKKRKKVFTDLKECDLVLLMINPADSDISFETEILISARELDKQVIVIYNLFKENDIQNIDNIIQANPLLRFYKKITIKANDLKFRNEILDYILNNFSSRNAKMELLPFIEKDEYYILVVPMDIETPQGRYLRPQAMAEEYITRKWAYPVSFRPDLAKARSKDPSVVQAEKERFLAVINNLGKRPKAVITDSQAMDVMNPWCPKDIMLTTFSITMINYVSRGRLNKFVEGIKGIENLKKGDKVLISEACNHSRIGEDIGTVQIPKYFKKHYPGLIIDFNFGREFEENKNLSKYKLIIHCGGCQISSQKIFARINDLDSVGIPYTNYGLFLSNLQGKEALERVIKPWGLNI